MLQAIPTSFHPISKESSQSKEVTQVMVVKRDGAEDRGEFQIDAMKPLLKSLLDARAMSGQGAVAGEQPWPIAFDALSKLRRANVHHNTCLETATASAVGLGFLSPEAKARRDKGEKPVFRQGEQSNTAKILNEFTDRSFQEVLNPAIDNFFDGGNGYIEVKRDGDGPNDSIIGLHHIHMEHVKVLVEDEAGNFHYIIRPVGSVEKHFALFGDRQRYFERNPNISMEDRRATSEVIHFKQGGKWYGQPKWLPAVQKIELSQCADQDRFDFYLNRGVTDFVLVVRGGKLSKTEWDEITAAMKSNIGIGNGHKSIAINPSNPNVEVTVLHLVQEGQAGSLNYATDLENLAVNIVSAHRTPPLLAGIQIPGKLGASNELPNAIQSYQLLVIGPAQYLIQQTLATSLGDPVYNGGLSLTPEDFALVTLLDAMDLAVTSTVSQMRQPLPEAQAQGRDLTAGVKG